MDDLIYIMKKQNEEMNVEILRCSQRQCSFERWSLSWQKTGS